MTDPATVEGQGPTELIWSCPRADCITQISTTGEPADPVQDVHDQRVADHQASHVGVPDKPLQLTQADRDYVAAVEAEMARVAAS